MHPTALFAAALLAACVPTVQPPQVASPAAIQDQQREAFARGQGYPTKKTAQELEAAVQRQTTGFHRVAEVAAAGKLEAPAPVVIQGAKDTCYTVVLRLAPGANWGIGAEAGLRLAFRSPTGAGEAGPGLIGPGVVAAVGCAEADGPITLTVAPMIGADPIGLGGYASELWSRTMTPEEARHLRADKEQQIEEQRAAAARDEAQKRDRQSAGCAKCNMRYQGCLGARRAEPSCHEDFRQCAFEQVGPDYLAVCAHPTR
jgi:hypothetical protein